jgi:aminopeptidase N
MSSTETTAVVTDSNLTQEEAVLRSTIIETGLFYKVFLDLHKGETFNGLVEIGFKVKRTDADTFLEFSGKKLTTVELNGTNLPEFKLEKGYLHLPKELLKEGLNTFIAQFENNYFHDGNGIHSYIDEDGNQYIHTQTEPHAGNRIFPMFDQPNLKANFEVYSKIPSSWVFVTNEPVVHRHTWAEFSKQSVPLSAEPFYTNIRAGFPLAEGSEDTSVFLHHEPTPLLSTYLPVVVAGDFVSIKCPAENQLRNIPQTLYVKKSLLQYAEKQAANIFELNTKGVAKYEQIFGYNYPFRKCDTIFCPEYTMGAMENPGAITYNEYMLYTTDTPTKTQETGRAATILHELAHIWFGDLVTMDWWDDLWLNESFADFVCYLNMHLIIPELSFKLNDSWLSMHGDKSFGYNADECPETTHPIYANVPDIQTTQSIFDGITYTKGASTLKQLWSLIGHENFCTGMKAYFHKHQWKNTKLNDLLEELEKVIPSDQKSECFDLQRFRKDWIETAGHNVVCCSCNYAQKAAEAKLIINQSSFLENYPLLRYHKIRVGFFAECGKLLSTQDVIIQNKKDTEITYDASQGVAGIILNLDDLDFIKFELDSQTLSWFKKAYSGIESELTRALVWRAIFDQVKAAKGIKNSQLLELVLDCLPLETDAFVIEILTSFAGEVLHNYSCEAVETAYAARLFNCIYDALIKSTDTQVTKKLVDLLIKFAKTDENHQILKDYYEGKHTPLAHAEPELLQKWRLIFKLNSWAKLTNEEKNSLTEELAKSDSTDLKHDFKEMIRGLRLTEEERALVIKSIDEQTHGLSFERLGYYLAGFNSKNVAYSIRSKFFDEYFEKLPNWINNQTHEMCKTIVSDMLPEFEPRLVLNEKIDAVLAKITNNYFVRKLKRIAHRNKIAHKVIEFGKPTPE